MNADGGNQTRLTTNPSYDAEPAFSPTVPISPLSVPATVTARFM